MYKKYKINQNINDFNITILTSSDKNILHNVKMAEYTFNYTFFTILKLCQYFVLFNFFVSQNVIQKECNL